MLRWRVNLARWAPDDDTLDDLAAALPPADGAAVRAFIRPPDRARSVVSRHLQLAAVAAALGVTRSEVKLARTVRGGKPFVVEPGRDHPSRVSSPNATFSTSHDGPWVVLAFHPLLLVGVDVAAPQAGSASWRGVAARGFRVITLPREWAAVAAAPTPAAQDTIFRRHWALKEAFVKARGDGVAGELGGIEFSFDDHSPSRPRLTLDGAPAPDWAFEMVDLHDGSALATALGAPRFALDAGGTLIASLGVPHVSAADVTAAAASPWSDWVDVLAASVLPDDVF